MSDFTGVFWSFFIAAVTLLGIVGCALLLLSLSRRKVATDADTTGHVWDEDLGEYNNALPMWWIWLFVITIVFSAGYLVLYPGLGSFRGTLKWTSAGEYAQEVRVAEEEIGPLYKRLAATDLKTLSRSPEARVVGARLFMTYCAQCHASDARGSKGFPNLTDDAWLYGGETELIEKTILDGRNGVMPAFGPVLGAEGVKDAASYVRSLSGLVHDSARAARGKATFTTICSACHGTEGKGNQALGAPDLTDKVWEYGSSEAAIIETITNGRNNVMPAHRQLLGEARVHVLAAYVYGLSHERSAKQALIPVAATK
jgi:cytochrome c oxidase cbb3-type subunit 3